MAKLGRRNWMISTLGALAACRGRQDPYALPTRHELALSSEPSVIAQTLCGACPAACGINVRVARGRALSIEGNTKAIFNKGRICPLGCAGIEGLYHPQRVAGPMLRVGPRGQAHFQPISWENAIHWLVERLAQLQANGTPERLALLEGQGSWTTSQLWSRFLKVFGSPNHFALQPFSENIAEGSSNQPEEDLQRATYILAVGESSFEVGASWIPLVASQARAHRPILGCASPRSPLAGPTPDEFFPIFPESASLLLLSLAQVVASIRGKLHARVLPNGLEPFAPAQVANRVGLPAGEIERLGKRLAHEKLAVILPDEAHNDQTHDARRLLRKCLGQPSQPVRRSSFQSWPQVVCDTVAQKGVLMTRLDGQPAASQAPARGGNLVKALLSEPLYKPSILMLSGEGLQIPDKALSQAKWVVNFSSYLDNTAGFSDLLLPNHHYLEAWDIHPIGKALDRFGQSRPAILPFYPSRATGDVIVALARGLGVPWSEAFPWTDHKAAVQSLFSEEALSELKATGFWTDTFEKAGDSVPQVASALNAPLFSGEISNTYLPNPNPAFPFFLVPVREWRDSLPNLQRVNEIPFVSGNPYVPRLEIHPTDARHLGIRNGEGVQVETPHFNVVAQALLRRKLRRGVLAMNRCPIQFSVSHARVRPAR